MPVTYQAPGVYVEEIDKGTKPIEAVGTSMAAFIGFTSKASRRELVNPKTGEEKIIKNLLNQPIRISNWRQFKELFGDLTPNAYLPDAVYGYFANGGTSCFVTSLRALDEPNENSPEGFVDTAKVNIPAKGKGTAFTVSARTPGPQGNQLEISVEAGEANTFSIRVKDEVNSGLGMKKAEENFVENAEFTLVKISDAGPTSAMPEAGTYRLSGGGIRPLDIKSFLGDSLERTGLAGLEAEDEVRLVICPDAMVGYQNTSEDKERVKMIQEALITHCERLKYRFAVLDTPPDLNPQEVLNWRNYTNFDSKYAALYYPWLLIPDLVGGGAKKVPPSGAMVGIYNRSDSERGVHKAPANELVFGTIALERHISREDQDGLNPRGINCIRSLPGRGIRVWGGRTLSSDGSWRYINVRRLFIMVEASMDIALQWVVFEPNDSNLWAKVRRDITAFLRAVWRSGALFGSAPEQAFYVKCDEELNPPEIRDLGQLVIEVGLAPVKPAEFVIFRITQWAGADAEA